MAGEQSPAEKAADNSRAKLEQEDFLPCSLNSSPIRIRSSLRTTPR
ncbi:hypothetical protein MBH78_22430 [Oceanimonas sp. NS1]|nr:hypothetical protein [Oceanimonas sp. NS1]